jgi:TPP-dependent pyruvate/acetoin dehydrogenase alpha subunit
MTSDNTKPLHINDQASQLVLLERMMLIRSVEEEIAKRYSEQEMRCPTHLSIGQEAVGATAGLILRSEDQAVSTHRAHAHYLGKGGDLGSMLAEIYGKVTGCSAGKGGSMHLVDRSVGFIGSTAIVGNTIPVGVGIGLSNKIKGNDLISCIFLGDAAVEEGAFHEAANFAVLHRLPVLFICENNLYSVYSPLSVRQPEGRKIHKWVEGYGMPAACADGNNPQEISDLITNTVEEIRIGGGPAFLEFPTYRWREHCGPNYDNELGYRTIEEYEQWKKNDPIIKQVNYLQKEKWLSEEDLSQMVRSINHKVDQAFVYAKNSPFPHPEDAFKHIFAKAE